MATQTTQTTQTTYMATNQDKYYMAGKHLMPSGMECDGCPMESTVIVRDSNHDTYEYCDSCLKELEYELKQTIT